MRILGVCGSLRRSSYNRMLLDAAADTAARGVVLELLDGIEQLPPYNEELDVESAPDPVRRLREAIAVADGVLIATPEYNGSVPGALKNALDWASRPFPQSCLRGKPVAVIGASTGVFGAVWAQAELRRVLTAIGAAVVGAELPVSSAHRAFSGEGRLVDRQVEAALAAVLDELVARASALAA